MTLGSELEVAQPAVIESLSKAEDNDSGHSSVNTPESDLENAQTTDKMLTVTVQPTVGEPFDLNVHDTELVQELFQTLLDREQTCHRTCFSLAINGNQIDNYSEVRNVPGFVDGCTISVVDEPYTVREARLHLRQLREILKVGLNQDPHDPACNTDGSPTFLPTVNLQSDPSNRLGEWKNDFLPPDHILPLSKERSFAHILVPPQKPIIAVKSVSVSPFNPPPGPRKLRGDVLYIDIVTAENRTYHVTCATKGFYINNSQDSKFDPTQSNAHKTVHHSLVELLQNVSPIFKKNYPLLMKRRNEKTMVEKIPTSYPTASWIAPTNRIDTFTEDPIRAEELTEPFRVGFEDNMPGLLRDWNEELQTTYEMPRGNLNERAVRDRSYYKIHADFVNAAAKGAQAIIDGNIVAINPGDERKTHMYIWNNIFFSLGFDVKDHYKELGGDAAAFAATSADLQGVRAIASLEDPKLNVLGMAIFDYRGYRVTAQSIIPGILEREQEQSVIYGSIDFGKTIVSDESYHELLADVGKQLKILPHNVLTTKDGEEKELKLFTSYETKGIIGNDGRKYVLDLLRTMPPDVHFLEDAGVSEISKKHGFPRKFPHKLAALRRELIDLFCESKFVEFIKSSAGFIRNEVIEANESKNEERIKLLGEAENLLSQAFVDISEDKPVTFENNSILEKALLKAYAEIHSLKDDQYEIKFNPDCFSPLIKHAPSENLEKQRQLVIEAAEFVLTTQIPELAKSLLECSLMPIDGEGLSDNMHMKGINIRYLGDVAKHVDTTNSFARPLVLSELIARSAKHVLRKINVQTSSEQLATSLAHILNCLFGSVTVDVSPTQGAANKKNSKKNGKKRSGSAWSTLTTQSLWANIVEESTSYYGYPIESESLEQFCELHDIQKTALLRRICRVLGLQIAARDYSLDNSNGKKLVFTDDDIINVYPVIKHQQPFTADAKKMMVRGQHAMSMGSPRDAFECVGESISLMTAVYGIMHQDMPQPLHALARLSHVMGESAEALHQQYRATIMSERLIGLDAGATIVEYISLAHYAFTSLLFPESLKPLYRARYLLNVVFGEKHPLMAQIDANIGTILFTMQDYETALKFLHSADRISKQIGEPKKLKSGLITNLIARTLAMRGDFRPALVAEKETYATFKELYGENHYRTQESGEYLRTLTQQAVTFQKKMMDANNKTTISELIHVKTPSVKSIFDVLNIINGILIISTQNLVAPSQIATNSAVENSDQKSILANQLETETLD
ncbi:unnamed protein product [Caenorhabditis angaria]|uniref:Clustered mitochondria protein homolog n=1 Tax=Caenorhabditis angaria TaxID=860376 RepID=A0A9P1II35_9PELO|nr:unnamed protein product [Caenorhabditis angaria]